MVSAEKSAAIPIFALPYILCLFFPLWLLLRFLFIADFRRFEYDIFCLKFYLSFLCLWLTELLICVDS